MTTQSPKAAATAASYCMNANAVIEPRWSASARSVHSTQPMHIGDEAGRVVCAAVVAGQPRKANSRRALREPPRCVILPGCELGVERSQSATLDGKRKERAFDATHADRR
eukprot:gb/GEZJ01008153.1/.p2 GENE.gb/GEZJ01008153.1/~~gb/GEZJ01008153.1/.p2  ORF type:complete len:110 (+),score=5.83 gb/GEZJ01008153.1/:344-673(+)